MAVSMEALKSTALVPGEPEYKTEYNLLNMLLLKIPKDVDLRLILKARPLQPRHIVALEELHGELFPIRYDPKFFVVACSTESGFFDRLAFQDLYEPVPVNSRDLDWYENQIMSVGLFLPRSYVSFFRKTGEYEITKYIQYMEDGEKYSEFDDPLTEMLIYDAECDEFMVGFVTMLINLEVTNNLISDDDYKILNTFYKYNVVPLITNNINKNNNNKKNSTHNKKNNSKEDTDHTREQPSDDEESESQDCEDCEEERKIRRCIKLNEELFDEKLYAFIYNQLYTNECLMDYVDKFDILEAKSIYILSTGITLGLRRRSLGTNLVLFVQLLVYYINHSIYICDNQYYKLKEPFNKEKKMHNKLYRTFFNHSNHTLESNRNTLNVIKNYYNNKVVDEKFIYQYYSQVLETSYEPTSSSIVLGNYLKNQEVKFTRNEKKGENFESENEVREECLDGIDQMPLAIYLHTIYYNDIATKMYENLNFYKITSIQDYYRINDKKYDANFLAHYVQL